MAKLALINREAKRAKLVEKFAAKRAALVATVNDTSLPDEERMAARLALQTGATVVLARCERLSWGRGFDLYFEDLPSPLPAEMDAAVLHLNQAMEHLIRQCPQQYLWGYGRYKQPRAEAPAVEASS